MSALPSKADILSARAISESEWKELRLQSIAAGIGKIDTLDAVLLSYQQKLLATVAAFRVTIVEKSRRTGATWGIGAYAVLTSSSARAAGGMDSLYIGYNLDMAREFIDCCAMWARAFNQALVEGGVNEFMFDDGKDEKGVDKSISAFRIRFASGFEIVALASRPRSLRGRQGFVIIDEAAFHDDLKELMKAALALLIWGGRVLVISTHNGEGNAYNELVKEARSGSKGYGFVRFDFDDALKDGLYQRVCLRTNEAWSVEGEAAWRAGIIREYGEAADEELFCIPSEGDGIWLPGPLIEARADKSAAVLRFAPPQGFTFWPEEQRRLHVAEWCAQHLKPLLDQLDPRLFHFFGGDYARVRDLSVFWVLALGPMLQRLTPFVVELRATPFDAQKQIQSYILNRLPRFAGAKLDSTGLGMSLAEAAQQEFGPERVEAVTLSVPWYRDNAQPLKTAFEDGSIAICADPDIYADLRLIKTRGGVPFVPALKSGEKKNRHGDSAVALMLAYAASRMPPQEYGYTPANDDAAEGDWLFPETHTGERAMVKILGPDGQPIDMALLKGQTAAPEQYGQRALDFTSEASGLTPTRLALIMSQANHGFARAYLTLAIDMEERYLHYASQLQTRRLALDGVTLSVSAPSGVNPKAVDLVQSVTESPLFRDLVQDLQDGLGKGYSVAEPAWDYASGALRPVAYHHRDPRFFRYDAIGMTQLCLADFSGEPGAPLARPYFIVHEPKTRAGAPIRRGLARSAAWAFIIQSFTLQDWAAFCEIYGVPLRLGKFGQGATEQDKRILLNAVRSIANDAAAIIPASMEIEFREVSGARGEQVFGNLIGYLDRKISMIVLGQTMTAEDGGSLAQAKIHNEVRRDILRSDARQTASTLNRDLIEPLVAMNLGPQDVYPILQLEIAASEDLQALGQFLKDTVPLGLKVGQGFVRKKASIPDPDNEDELLGPRTEKQSQAPEATQTARQAAPPQEPTQKPALHAAGCGCCARQHAQLAAAPVASPEQTQVELDAIGSAALSDWRQVEDGLLAGLLAAVNGASSFEDAITRLEAATVDAGPLARRLAIATMQARGLGDQED